MIFGVLLVLFLGWSSRDSAATAPAPMSLGTPLFSEVGIPASQWVDVVVTANNANPFDTFDVREVVIRVGDSQFVDSGIDGQLRVPFCNYDQSIWAWAPGYAINSVPCNGQVPYRIELTHLDAIDSSYYIWSAAANNCNTCHGNQFLPNPETGASYDEINEWFRSGHGNVFTGGYFESMYKGTSVTGKPGIPAQPVIIDNEWVPVPPEISHLYHGPGFRLDFPYLSGDCAYCHVPAAVQAAQDGVDLNILFLKPEGALGEGGFARAVKYLALQIIMSKWMTVTLEVTVIHL